MKARPRVDGILFLTPVAVIPGITYWALKPESLQPLPRDSRTFHKRRRVPDRETTCPVYDPEIFPTVWGPS